VVAAWLAVFLGASTTGAGFQVVWIVVVWVCIFAVAIREMRG